MRLTEVIKQRCTVPNVRAGYSLIEVMLSMSITTLIGAALLANIGLQREVFMFTRASNQNAMDSGLLMHRLMHGDGDIWGLKLASRDLTVITSTGVVSGGVQGWQAVVPHNLGTGLTAPLDTTVQTFVFNPSTETITVNGTQIGDDVVDSYIELDDGYLRFYLRTETDSGGRETTMESRVYLRNP